MKNICYLVVFFSLSNLLTSCNNNAIKKKEFAEPKVKYDCNQFFGFNSLDSFTYCFRLSNNFRKNDRPSYFFDHLSHLNRLTDDSSELLITYARLSPDHLKSKVDTPFIRYKLREHTKMPGFLIPDDQIIFMQDTPNVVYRYTLFDTIQNTVSRDYTIYDYVNNCVWGVFIESPNSDPHNIKYSLVFDTLVSSFHYEKISK
jgi:hypothetical protein